MSDVLSVAPPGRWSPNASHYFHHRLEHGVSKWETLTRICVNSNMAVTQGRYVIPKGDSLRISMSSFPISTIFEKDWKIRSPVLPVYLQLGKIDLQEMLHHQQELRKVCILRVIGHSPPPASKIRLYQNDPKWTSFGHGDWTFGYFWILLNTFGYLRPVSSHPRGQTWMCPYWSAQACVCACPDTCRETWLPWFTFKKIERLQRS